jgi:hypothetical protein
MMLAKVPIEVEQSGCTPVLALTCGESSSHSIAYLCAAAAREGDGKTKRILLAMKRDLHSQGRAGGILRSDIERMLKGT